MDNQPQTAAMLIDAKRIVASAGGEPARLQGRSRRPAGTLPRTTNRTGLDISRSATPNPMRRVGSAELEAMASMALQQDVDAIVSNIEGLLARGFALDTIILDLLGPVACRLGDLWTADHCSFVQVAVGVMCLQQALRRVSTGWPEASDRHQLSGRQQKAQVLLMPAPGEQHSFGLVIVGEFFRRAGWRVQLTAPMSDRAAVGRVSRDWFAVVALSLASVEHLASLSTRIRMLRRASLNPDIVVLVGGPAFAARPALAAAAGADGTAADANGAVQAANRLLGLPPFRA